MIHPSAIVSASVQIGDDVHIGPYCVVGDHVVLEDHVKLYNHVVIEGHTKVGAYTEIYPFASIGTTSQNQNIYDEGARLEIGTHNIIREYVSIQPGIKPPKGRLATRIGNHNLLMTHVVVSHDCIVGDHCIFAVGASLAGHVEIGDYVTLGGSVGIHQWVRIGDYAMIGGLSGVAKDVLPYALAYGTREVTCHGPNIVGLRRHNFSRDEIRRIMIVYDYLQQPQPMEEKLNQLFDMYQDDSVILPLLLFAQNIGQRGMTQWTV